MPTAHAILDQEIAVLSELIELARELAHLERPGVAELEAAVARRGELIRTLDRLEAEAAGMRETPIAADTVLDEKVKTLLRLAAQVETAEKDVEAHLRAALDGLRGDAKTLLRGQEGLRSYGGPLSHLSRFTDRKG